MSYSIGIFVAEAIPICHGAALRGVFIMMRAFLMAALAVGVLAITAPSSAQELQSATVQLIPCALHPGCIYLTRFTVLRGHDRHLVGILAPPSRIGGENYNRSIYGILPFVGMNVTVQPTDYPGASEMLVPVDGPMYDAELLGPHPYVLRFYLTPQGMEGTKFTCVEIDLRDTAPLTKVRRDLTAGDLPSSGAP